MREANPFEAPQGPPAQPYPQGAERKRINAAMARLVTALRESGALRKALETAARLRAQGTAMEGAA